MPDQHTRARLRETSAQTKRSAYTTDGTHAAARALPKRASGGPPGGAIPQLTQALRFRQDSGPEPMRSPHMGHRRSPASACMVRALARGQPAP